MRSVYWEVGT